MMRRFLIGVLMVMPIAACIKTLPLEQRLRIACSSYTDVLQTLTIRNKLRLLSLDAQDRVDMAVSVIAPICEGALPPNPGDVLVAVETALTAMILERDGDVR